MCDTRFRPRTDSTSGARRARFVAARPVPAVDRFLRRVELGAAKGSDYVHWNELGQGDTHSENDAMVILSGGAPNYFKRGRYLDFQNKLTFADMLVSCFQYMGYPDVTKFGDDRLNDGAPLRGLTA